MKAVLKWCNYHIPLSPTHTVFACCLGVLVRLDEVMWYDASEIPLALARYAARYWVVHARFEDVSSHIRDMDKPH